MGRGFVFVSAVFTVVILGGAAAESAHAQQTPAQPPWSVHSDVRGLQVRMDELGNKISAVRDHEALRESEAPAANLVTASWRGLGPFGGDIAAVRASPTNASIVLAGLAPTSGAGGGLYRSTDAGATWNVVAALANESVQAIAFAPNGTAYLGTLDATWKSIDGGATWTHQNLGIGLNDQVLAVTIDPVNAQRIWIGIGDALGSQPVNVMLSTNGGTSWTNKTPPLTAPITCYTIAIDPLDANRIYAGFGGFGGAGQVWVSTNGGTNWANRSAGLPNVPVHALVHDGARVLVGGGELFGSQNFGLFSSSNDGVLWTPLHDATWPNLVTQCIAIDPNNFNVIYVGTAGKGLFRSTTGGTNWSFQVGGTGLLSVNDVSFSPGSSSVMYTGSASNAVWKSIDSGANFAPSSVGIGALDVFSIDSNPLNASELAIAFQGQNNGGVYTTIDGGLTWSLESAPATRYNLVRFSPAGVLYAISDGPSGVAPEAVYRRTGTTWTPIGPDQGPLFETELYGMRVSANNADMIVTVGQDFGVAGFEPTAWLTTDGGAHWTKTYEGVLPSQPLQDVWLVDPATDTTFVAPYTDFSGAQQGGVLRSTDGGVSWLPANSGLPALIQSYSVAGVVTSPNTLYISNNQSASGHGLFRSIDGGASWSSTNFIGAVQEVATDIGDPNIVYIAMSTAPKVRVSTNNGGNFSPYDTGLAAAGFPRDLQRAPGAGDDLLFAGSTGSFATRLVPPTSTFCYGDGVITACPCGNASPNGVAEGCLNSFGTGAALTASGGNSVAGDSVVLTATGMPPSTSALFFQGTAEASGGFGSVFGDGLRCVNGNVIRLGTEVVSLGAASYPGPGDLHVSVKGLLPAGGGLYFYQTWYRNAASFCAAETFNLSNGLTIPWVP